MSKKNKDKNRLDYNPEVKLDIPDDEVWTYQVEGLAAPMIGKTVKNAAVKKVAVVIILVVAISLSIFFSVRTIHSETFNYTQIENGWEFVRFSNPGDIKEITIDCVDGDEGKPITEIHEYAFNCDDKLITINIGKSVEKIDGKSFYSVWNLQNIHVDEENPNYCDLDGVLYNKDMTEVVCYPIDHDAYLREKNGFKDQLWPDEKWKSGTDENRFGDVYTREYEEKVNTYVIPNTVKKIGELAFNYSELFVVYLPDGLERIETMGFFRNWHLAEIFNYSGKTDGIPTEGVKPSLPDSLEFIGSDAFSYNQCLTYMFIPASVTEIGHHAFWDAVFKDNGEIRGLSKMNVAADEKSFKENTKLGDHWLPQYDHKLFKKTIDQQYNAERAK